MTQTRWLLRSDVVVLQAYKQILQKGDLALPLLQRPAQTTSDNQSLSESKQASILSPTILLKTPGLSIKDVIQRP
jgi:hypothetical protein